MYEQVVISGVHICVPKLTQKTSAKTFEPQARTTLVHGVDESGRELQVQQVPRQRARQVEITCDVVIANRYAGWQ